MKNHTRHVNCWREKLRPRRCLVEMKVSYSSQTFRYNHSSVGEDRKVSDRRRGGEGQWMGGGVGGSVFPGCQV